MQILMYRETSFAHSSESAHSWCEVLALFFLFLDPTDPECAEQTACPAVTDRSSTLASVCPNCFSCIIDNICVCVY